MTTRPDFTTATQAAADAHREYTALRGRVARAIAHRATGHQRLLVGLFDNPLHARPTRATFDLAEAALSALGGELE